MAFNLDFIIGEKNQAGENKASWTADPVWKDADEAEVPGSELNGVTYFSSDPRVTAVGDPDVGKISIDDTTAFQPGETILITITGDPAPGEDDPLIILEALLTATAPAKKPATHADLILTKDA